MLHDGGGDRSQTVAALDVVMLHDGGGDRSQTVAALDELITQLQRRGYTFDTVSSAANAPPWHPATMWQRIQGRMLDAAVRVVSSSTWLSSSQ